MADIHIILYKNIIRNVSLLVIDNYDLTTGDYPKTVILYN